MNVIIGKCTPTARALARAMGLRVRNPARHEIRRGSTCISWGYTGPTDFAGKVINAPNAVAQASDKIVTFRTLQEVGVPTVPYTTDPEEALAWHNDRKTIYARTLTRGAKGRGIIVVRPDDPLTMDNIRGTPLFTRFIKCDYECRVHVVNDQVIDFAQKKRKRLDNPHPLRYWIRNHDTGWVFAREGFDPHVNVLTTGRWAVNALGLDFGAVDVRVKGDKSYVLEVNSAPGLEGTTLDTYADALKEMLHA